MKPKMLILATRNRGKVRELAEPLSRFGFEVRLPDPSLPDVEETGFTFRENALLKARALVDATGCPALADDSGLEVDALGGRPGVYSARYGDDLPFYDAHESRDQRNIRKLLAELEAVPAPRTARFRCSMALVFPDQETEDIVVDGTWEGSITTKPLGTNGFGYDPVFWDVECARTAAQLDPAEKMCKSHRGKALQRLLDCLEKDRV